MSNNILKVQFEPTISSMSEVLSQKGFRPLKDYTPADLPAGAVVLLYKHSNHTITTIVICEHNYRGFSYMFFNALNREEPDVVHMDMYDDFHKWYCKVLMHLPEVTPNPDEKLLQKLFAEVGFKNLGEATPEDLPQGCIALIADASTCKFYATICRVLSLSNQRYLYLRQSAQVAGDWEDDVILGHLKPLKNFTYLVIS